MAYSVSYPTSCPSWFLPLVLLLPVAYGLSPVTCPLFPVPFSLRALRDFCRCFCSRLWPCLWPVALFFVLLVLRVLRGFPLVRCRLWPVACCLFPVACCLFPVPCGLFLVFVS